MRSIVVAVVSCLVVVAGARAAGAAAAFPDSAGLRSRIVHLTSPRLAGREAGTAGEDSAAALLEDWFAAAGLQPAFAGAWRQPFALRGDSLAGRTSQNVAGLVPGAGALAGRWIVIGAHLDHLGTVAGAAAGRSPAPGEYYPGANDDAAGVAAVAAVAGELAADASAAGAVEEARRGVILVGFGAEEVGLQGSAWFVDNPPVAADSLDAMINLDAVGALTDDVLYVGGTGSSPGLDTLVREAAGTLPLRTSHSGWSGGDHVAFLVRRVPALALFGGPYPQYNSPEDDLRAIDIGDLGRVTAYAFRLARALRTWPQALPYVEVAASAEPGERIEGDRSTWLGTVPDFAAEDPGYRIGAVTPGGPADRGGLRAGDLMVGFAGREVTDLASFTRALREHSPGEPVEIAVRRQGRTLRFTVVLGDRRDRP